MVLAICGVPSSSTWEMPCAAACAAALRPAGPAPTMAISNCVSGTPAPFPDDARNQPRDVACEGLCNGLVLFFGAVCVCCKKTEPSVLRVSALVIGRAADVSGSDTVQ